MKNYIIIALVIVLLASSFFLYRQFNAQEPQSSTNTTTEENKMKEIEVDPADNFPIHYAVPTDKEWAYFFDEELAADSITEQSVFVLDEDENVTMTKVKLTDNNHTIVIDPPKDGYEKGGYYELHMADTLTYTDGDTVSTSYKMGFFVARDEIEDVIYNKELIPVDKAAIVSDKDNTLVLSKAALSVDLIEGNLLTVPTIHEVFDEKAIKIETVTDADGELTISYSQPTFQEMFEKIDIYKTYSLVDEDVLFFPAEGVEMEEFASAQPEMMLAASSKASTQKEFQNKPSVSAGYNKGYHFNLKGIKLPLKKGAEVTIDLATSISNPEVLWDLDLSIFKLNRLNAQMSYSSKSTIKSSLNLPKDMKKKDLEKLFKKKSSKKNPWLLEKKIKFGTVYVPVGPGIFVEGNLSGVIGYNLLTGDSKLELSKTVSKEDKMTVGLKKKKEEIKLIWDYDSDVDAAMSLKGGAEAKAAVEVQVGLSALEVVGLGIKAEGGAFAAGEGIAAVTNNKNASAGWCYKYDTGSLIGGGVVLDALYFFDEIASFKVKEQRSLTNSVNTCENLTDITVSPTTITAKPGDTVELSIKGTYWDESTGNDFEKDLLSNKLLKEKLTIETKDEGSAYGLFRTLEETSSYSVGTKFEKDLLISRTKEQPYKAVVKIPKDPTAASTTITIDYDGKFQKEIPITLKGIQTEMSQEEASKLMAKLIDGVFDTYDQLGSQYNWSNISNPPKLDVIEPELMKYATERFTTGDLRKLTKAFYCDCDDYFSPNVDFDVRTTIHENSMNKLTVSTPNFASMYSGGHMSYFTAVKENGQWKLDNWDAVSPELESMNVTWEEYSRYQQNLSAEQGAVSTIELINEVTVNGQKIYVYKNGTELYAVYAHNTEYEYEYSIPSEWLPDEYQQQNSGWDGVWTSYSGMTGTLAIDELTDNEFEFSLSVTSPTGHAGDLEGKAVTSGNTAEYSDEYSCIVDFVKNDDSIELIESPDCLYWHGAGATFESVYYKD